ncbi:MAG: sterol desaturase family protein [Aquisalinus sp.]|nr:sterol desaturase family protein [Aquisalinus sp.]
MPEMPDLPKVEEFAGPIYMVLILLEIFLITGKRAKGIYETRDATVSVAMGLGSAVVPLLVGGAFLAGIYAILFWFYQFAPFKWEFTIWAFLACFLLDDLRYYWSHRFSHTIRWGWANHVIHHSSQHYNLSTALRQPWFSFTTGFFVLKIPLVLLGFHPAMIAFAGSVNLLYQFFIHTETVGRLHPWIESVFNTPSHHRVHHGRNPRYLDANYAGVLIVWDKMFGTFVPEDDSEPVRYGIIKSLGTFNPLRVATHEYVAIGQDISQRGLSLKQRLAYIFAPPGWSHDGSRKRSRALKADFVQKYPELAGQPGLPSLSALDASEVASSTKLGQGELVEAASPIQSANS